MNLEPSRMCTSRPASNPINRAQVASAATGSSASTIFPSGRGLPLSGPLPSIATIPSAITKWTGTLPAVLLYFRPGDAIMACFDDECEHWGQETPEPNPIIPVRPEDPASVRQALAVIETLMKVLVLTVRIKNIVESREKSKCDSVSMSEANSN